MTDTTLYPAYKQALKIFEDAKFTYGDLIPKEWFYQSFGLKMPSGDMPYREAEEIQLKFLSQFMLFQEALAEDKFMVLDNVRGDGYRIVTSADQTKWAEEEARSAVQKTLNKAIKRQTYVNMDLLTDEQRKENADALARVGMMKSMVHGRRYVGLLEEKK